MSPRRGTPTPDSIANYVIIGRGGEVVVEGEKLTSGHVQALLAVAEKSASPSCACRLQACRSCSGIKATAKRVRIAAVTNRRALTEEATHCRVAVVAVVLRCGCSWSGGVAAMRDDFLMAGARAATQPSAPSGFASPHSISNSSDDHQLTDSLTTAHPFRYACDSSHALYTT